jgi:hypothetical protein
VGRAPVGDEPVVKWGGLSKCGDHFLLDRSSTSDVP